MDEYGLESFATPEAARERLRAVVESAEDELLLSTPADALASVEPTLRDAHERDVLVFLLVGGDAFDGDGALADGRDVATVVRRWDQAEHISVICTADEARGLCAVGQVFDRPMDEDAGVVFDHPLLRTHLFSTVIGNTWPRAVEAAVADPDPLPETYDTFPRAVVNAMLHLREDRDVAATVEGARVESGEPVTLSGRVCNVRQGFVTPVTSSFPVETSLFVRDGDDVVTVGGPAAFVEDVEAFRTTLEPL